MQTKEWTYVNKNSWPDGPWMNEFDKKQWTTKAGLPALIVRAARSDEVNKKREGSNSGHLCGYVGVTKDHPYFEKYEGWGDDKKDPNCVDGFPFDVHGGITLTSFCDSDEEIEGICHIVEDGEDDKVWWFGFDCAHLHDVSGMGYGIVMQSLFRPGSGSYKDVDYVAKECEQLAEQLVALT